MYLLHSSTFIIFQNTSHESESLHCFVQNIFGASAPSVLFVKPCMCDIRFCGSLCGITYCQVICCMAYVLEMWELHYLTEMSLICNFAAKYNNKSRKRCWKSEWRRIHWHEEWECLYTISCCHKDWTGGEICCHWFCTFVCLIFVPWFAMPKKLTILCVCFTSYEIVSDCRNRKRNAMRNGRRSVLYTARHDVFHMLQTKYEWPRACTWSGSLSHNFNITTL